MQLPEVPRLSQDLFTRTYVALVLARAGRVDEASQLVEALKRVFPNQFEVQSYCLPVIRAAIQLSKRDPQAAVDVLRPMSQYDLAATRGFDYLYPAHLRGLAYLQLKQPDLAALEFQKLVDHPGIVEGVVIGALAYVQLARAQTASGDTKRAAESYGKFLDLWQGANEDIPVLREVKIESTRLRKISSR